MTKPVVVLVGRPNVGKSTLFNRLTGTRDALVADLPGLTRDRHYGHARSGDKAFFVVDTGGFEPVADDGILHEMARQTLLAIDEADVVVFLVDGRQGVTSQDKIIADRLRRSRARVLLAVNKVEGMRHAVVTAEFHELSLGEPLPISSAHGEGIADLMEQALDGFAAAEEAEAPDAATRSHPRIAIIGRPNVGKSTLVNSLLGEERVIAFDQPGTTRDSIAIDFDRDGRHYTLIDTAGVRKRGKVIEAIEKFSVIKTLQAVEAANVVVLVLDARQDIAEQDAHLADHVLETGRAVVLAVNKWDGLAPDQRLRIKSEVARKLQFLSFARVHYISALEGRGLAGLLASVDAAHAAAMAKLPTPKLTRALQEAVAQHQPAKVGPFRPKLRYAHQGGQNPPLVVIHGSAVQHIAPSYRRYLENFFRKAFDLGGAPLKVEFHQGRNPFADKKPAPLTDRQLKKLHRARIHGRKTWGKQPKKS